MPEQKTKPAPSRGRAAKTWAAAALCAALALWLLHPIALTWALTKALEAWSSANHLQFSAEKIEARFDRPVVLRGVKFRSQPGSGLATALDIPLFEWRWGGISSLYSDKEGFISELTVKGLSGIWDYSGKEPAHGGLLALSPARWMPRDIYVEAPALELLGKNEKWLVRDFSLGLSESATGQMEAGSLAVFVGGYTKSFEPLRARTAWKNGTLWLAGMDLAPGFTAENLSLDFLHAEGPAISLSAACFGGSLRSDLMFRAAGGTLDMAAWASGVPLAPMAGFLGIPGDIAGKLAEGRFTYRGHPDRPADAEASLRLMAEGFQWNKRGWESLEVGASLIHRRLVVTGFDLRQKENSLNFHGEVSLAEGWSQIAQSPFLVNFRADIRQLGALAGLLGSPFDETAGRMTASGAVAGRPGELDGFLNVEASDVAFRSLPPSSLRVESVFRKNEVDVVVCDLYSRKDTASVRGTVGIAAPHEYAAELDARIEDLAIYLAPFHAPGAEQIYAGALDVRWEGDGNFKSHSGAFDLKLREFVSRLTPAGLTGKFVGTYSPQNIYFSKIEIANGPLKLDSRATVAGSGVTLKDVELKTGTTSLFEGAAFVPLDLFAVFGGKDWRSAIDPEREAYLRLSTPKELKLRSLLELAGQDAPLEGLVRLNVEAGGPPARLSAKGALSARDLIWKHPGIDVPPSSLGLKFEAADGTATLGGLLETKKLPPAKLSARMPFGLVRTDAGDWKWANPAGAFEAALDFPQTELAVFQPFLPALHRLGGQVSGKLAFSGTIGAPQTNGKIELKGGGFELSQKIPAVAKTDALLTFDGRSLQIARLGGEFGGGTFQITGGIGLSDPANPAWDLRLRGEKVLLLRDEGLRLRANVDAALKGNNSAGSVTGAVRLVDGRLNRRLEITPELLSAPPENSAAQAFPTLLDPGAIPEPFAKWALDLKIENQTPFLAQGGIAPGKIVPEISLRGTLGQPVPVGRITLEDVEATLPVAAINIPEGCVDFLPDSPWIPLLDVRGTASLPGYEIQAYAFGPLNERKLILRSDPPLSQQALVALLTETGGKPAKPGQKGPADVSRFLPIPFSNRVDWTEAGDVSAMDGLGGYSSPRGLSDPGIAARGLRLTDGLNPAPERDGTGISNSAATYGWRFR